MDRVLRRFLRVFRRQSATSAKIALFTPFSTVNNGVICETNRTKARRKKGIRGCDYCTSILEGIALIDGQEYQGSPSQPSS